MVFCLFVWCLFVFCLMFICLLVCCWFDVGGQHYIITGDREWRFGHKARPACGLEVGGGGRVWGVWLDKGVQQMMVGRCSSMDQWVYGFVHCILSIIGVPGYTARRRPLGAVTLSIVGSIHSGLLPSSRKGWLTI